MRSLVNLFLGFLSCNIMVSRPVVLVFLLVILIVTSQFEWKQQLVNELESKARNQKHVSSREELVKDQVTHCVYMNAFYARLFLLVLDSDKVLSTNCFEMKRSYLNSRALITCGLLLPRPYFHGKYTSSVETRSVTSF